MSGRQLGILEKSHLRTPHLGQIASLKLSFVLLTVGQHLSHKAGARIGGHVDKTLGTLCYYDL